MFACMPLRMTRGNSISSGTMSTRSSQICRRLRSCQCTDPRSYRNACYRSASYRSAAVEVIDVHRRHHAHQVLPDLPQVSLVRRGAPPARPQVSLIQRGAPPARPQVSLVQRGAPPARLQVSLVRRGAPPARPQALSRRPLGRTSARSSRICRRAPTGRTPRRRVSTGLRRRPEGLEFELQLRCMKWTTQAKMITFRRGFDADRRVVSDACALATAARAHVRRVLPDLPSGACAPLGPGWPLPPRPPIHGTGRPAGSVSAKLQPPASSVACPRRVRGRKDARPARGGCASPPSERARARALCSALLGRARADRPLCSAASWWRSAQPQVRAARLGRRLGRRLVAHPCPVGAGGGERGHGVGPGHNRKLSQARWAHSVTGAWAISARWTGRSQ